MKIFQAMASWKGALLAKRSETFYLRKKFEDTLLVLLSCLFTVSLTTGIASFVYDSLIASAQMIEGSKPNG